MDGSGAKDPHCIGSSAIPRPPDETPRVEVSLIHSPLVLDEAALELHGPFELASETASERSTGNRSGCELGEGICGANRDAKGLDRSNSIGGLAPVSTPCAHLGSPRSALKRPAADAFDNAAEGSGEHLSPRLTEKLHPEKAAQRFKRDEVDGGVASLVPPPTADGDDLSALLPALASKVNRQGAWQEGMDILYHRALTECEVLSSMVRVQLAASMQDKQQVAALAARVTKLEAENQSLHTALRYMGTAFTRVTHAVDDLTARIPQPLAPEHSVLQVPHLRQTSNCQPP